MSWYEGSTRVPSPFFWLHSLHRGVRLSTPSPPPKRTGRMWSASTLLGVRDVFQSSSRPQCWLPYPGQCVRPSRLALSSTVLRLRLYFALCVRSVMTGGFYSSRVMVSMSYPACFWNCSRSARVREWDARQDPRYSMLSLTPVAMPWIRMATPMPMSARLMRVWVMRVGVWSSGSMMVVSFPSCVWVVGGTRGGIRTHTVLLLREAPLPVGLLSLVGASWRPPQHRGGSRPYHDTVGCL